MPGAWRWRASFRRSARWCLGRGRALGAVATQSYAKLGFGPDGSGADGRGAFRLKRALRRLLAADEGPRHASGGAGGRAGRGGRAYRGRMSRLGRASELGDWFLGAGQPAGGRSGGRGDGGRLFSGRKASWPTGWRRRLRVGEQRWRRQARQAIGGGAGGAARMAVMAATTTAIWICGLTMPLSR